MSSFPSYLNKEIPEWNSTDLSNWLLENKFKKISELCKKYNINGYDLFFINEEILKNEFGLNSFHERITTFKTLKKLIHSHLKLNIINPLNGDETTLLLDNNVNISLDDISKSIGNIFNINADDIIYKDYSKQQIISPTIKIVELMLLFPKLYKSLNIYNVKQEKNNYKQSILKNNKNNIKIKTDFSNDFDIKENYNKMINDFQNNNDFNDDNINNIKNNKKQKNINIKENIIKNNSKINIISGSNSSSHKPSIELYINENEDNIELNENKEKEKYIFNLDLNNQRNNIKVNRNYVTNKSPMRLINFNKPKSFKGRKKNNKSSIEKSFGKETNQINNNIYDNQLFNNNNKRYINFGISIENSDYLDKNASSNEGENKSKAYINNTFKNNNGDSEYSVKNNSFPSLSYSDKNNNEKNNKMDLRHLNNELLNDNDTKPLNMKQSYKGPQKNRVFNEDIIGGNL